MAKETIIRLTDDIDGSEAEETIVFGFRGTDYEVDLNAKNSSALEKALTKFMEAGRRVPKSPTRGRPASRHSGAEDLASVRMWARENGHEVSDRGRIPAAVHEAYRAGHR